MKVLLLLLSLAFACASGNQITNSSLDQYEPDNIITNGYAAAEGQVPYIVSLLLRTDGSNSMAIGGGIIIANTWVLTAAHCLTTDYVDIHYGSNWRGRGQYSHSVRNENFIRHHLWPDSHGYDIGLIRTPHVDFTSTVDKVNLPTFNQRNEQFVDRWALACGWGGQANGELADWLQCVDQQIMSNDECSRTYGSQPEGNLCVRTPDGKSICGGDSGGPLVTHDSPILVGISAFVSSSGCTAGDPAGFTRVTAHLDWIRDSSGVAYY